MKEHHQYRTLYISHGGGPLPLLGDAAHQEMVSHQKRIAVELPKPSAILLISAHWEQNQPTITGNENPELIYDYSGFPEESYNISYPAPGEPDLAKKLFDLLNINELNPVIDNSRGFDHGMFVPLKIMYPDADIPCVQLSLVNNLDPALHIEIGEAITEIQHEGLLIIGSGFSFHNMNAFFEPDNVQTQAANVAFEAWLIETCYDKNIDETSRATKLINWDKAPHAKFCHPREEHLLPLHVCYGLNKCASNEFLQLSILGKRASFYLW